MEYVFGREEVQRLLRALGEWGGNRKSARQPKIVSQGDGDLNHAPLSDEFARFYRLRSRTVRDWCNLAIDLNARVLGSTAGLRVATAILPDGDPWMQWHAPPDDLTNRMHDVVAHLVSEEAGTNGMVAAFPALILLHPFSNGNARTAFEFMKVLNVVRQSVRPDQVDAFIQRVRSNRLAVISAISQIRLSGDVAAYVEIAGSSLLDQESEPLSRTFN